MAREKQTEVTGERSAQKSKDIASYVKAVRVDILGLAEISVTGKADLLHRVGCDTLRVQSLGLCRGRGDSQQKRGATMAIEWHTKPMLVKSLHLDPKNPRLGREKFSRAPRDIIQYLFDHDKAGEVAESIAARGFFPNEPLLAIREGKQLVVVEGNRRLAALKALQEPGLLLGPKQKQLERLARRILDIKSIGKVPVTLAPDRRSTDRLIAGRHIGTPVLAWEGENRASFILDKLAEGYSNEELRDQLGFTLADIQKARQIRAIADMARSLALADEVKAKLDNPRAKVFTTLERVFDSSVGRSYMRVEPDAEHGLRGTTGKTEFTRAFSKLVSDVALGKASSRTLNKNENIKAYFEKWSAQDRPSSKPGTFVPSDVIQGKSVASSSAKATPQPAQLRQKPATLTVLPRTLKVRFGNDRLIDIRDELVALKRKRNPNAGAVLLRVFFELTAIHYLERTGELPKIIAKLGGTSALKFGAPTMKQLVPELVRIAKAKFSVGEANKVEKALRYDSAAPFTLSDLHAFVHQPSDPPGERDIWQFWVRTEPLFRLMLEEDAGASGA